MRCYFSFRSPYAWLAMRALDRSGWGIGSRLEYRPYFEPRGVLQSALSDRGGAILYTPMSRPRARYILGDVKRQLVAEGLSPRWPVDEDPDWSAPHLAFLACTDHDARKRFAFEVMEARWLRGENIWTWDFLEKLLGHVLGPAEGEGVAARARTEATGQEAVEALFQAYRDDVFGVPFMIAGREKFWGADRVDAFVACADAIEEARA